MTRHVTTTFIILSLALGLSACQGANSTNPSPTDGGETVTQQQTDKGDTTDANGKSDATDKADAEKDDTEKDEASDGKKQPTTDPTTIATLLPEGDANVKMVADVWKVKSYDSVDKLANAFISGEVSIALVSAENAAALYNATNGSLMAVDTVLDESSEPVAVTVVLNSCFKSYPEVVLKGMEQHQKIVTDTLGSGYYLQGSAMQGVLSTAIATAYVENPSSVGGSLPPDNFYFLG